MKNCARNGRLAVAIAAPVILLTLPLGTVRAVLLASSAGNGYATHAHEVSTTTVGASSHGPRFHFIGYGPIKNSYREEYPNTSTRCLDAQNNPPNATPNDNYDYVQIWRCNGQVNQNWTFEDLGNGWYKILNQYGNHLALTAEDDQYDNPSSNGDAVWMFNYFGGCDQQWQPVTVRGSPGSNDYLVKIVNRCASKVLDAENNQIGNPDQNGDYVQLWDYKANDNQEWHG